MVDLTVCAQRTRLLGALRMAGEIATSECRDFLHIMSPAARVLELRRMGYDIRTERRRIMDDAGAFHMQGVYILVSGGGDHGA